MATQDAGAMTNWDSESTVALIAGDDARTAHVALLTAE